MKLLAITVCFAACLGSLVGAGAQYEPTWESLDSRPLPAWYDEAKIGIFIHWGVFSVPSYHSAWFWEQWKVGKDKDISDFMAANYRPDVTYQDFASSFTAEFFEPSRWAEVFSAAGARYVVLTSKHHEGFTNWPSEGSWNWNSLDVGPKRDLVGDLASAVREQAPHIHFGLYHSMYEWFNPLYLMDKENDFKSNHFVTFKTGPELYDLVNTYKPDVVWSDGDWEAPDWYWHSTNFLAWLFNESAVKDTVVVNDRWGSGTSCKHGSYYTCHDRYNPGVLQSHKWENAMTLDRKAWVFRRNAPLEDFLSIHELLSTLAVTISCGGNLLVNIGPSHDGMLPAIMEERLRQMGQWLDINGEAIYASKPWTVQNDTLTPGVWYTSRDGAVYCLLLQWALEDVLTLGSVRSTQDTVITMLGDTRQRHLQFKKVPEGLQVALPSLADVSSQWVWVLKMAAVEPSLETEGIDQPPLPKLSIRPATKINKI